MKLLKNEKGIALVMVLVFGLIALLIVSALIYMVTQSTTITGGIRFFKTAEEASFGGVDLATRDYIDSRGRFNILGVALNGCDCGVITSPTDNRDIVTNARTCICDKICDSFVDWDTGAALCDENAGPAGVQVVLDPTQNQDFIFNLGVAPPNQYAVAVKIVDTVRGNSFLGFTGNENLGGTGVVETSGSQVSAPHAPYLYRLEIQAQATNNPREISRMSVLYAY